MNSRPLPCQPQHPLMQMSAHPQLLDDVDRQAPGVALKAARGKTADDVCCRPTGPPPSIPHTHTSPRCFQPKHRTSALKRQGPGFYLLFNANGDSGAARRAGKKSTISVHGWRGNEYVTPVRRRLAVRDGLLPAVALNDLCYDGAADERWRRRAVKYPILRLLNQACRLSKHTTAEQRGRGIGGVGVCRQEVPRRARGTRSSTR